MKLMRNVFPAIVLAILLGGCASTPQGDDAATFIVVRHAEKATDDPRDPSLSDAGQARAQRLAAWLADRDIAAIYATGYRRTQQTVQPTATAHGVQVETYDAAQPAQDFAAALRAAHASGTVLVAGHSNTVPGIASALCGCDVPDMDESVYGLGYEIRVPADGRATLSEHRLP